MLHEKRAYRHVETSGSVAPGMPPLPACSTPEDEDGGGHPGWPSDPGCLAPPDNSEESIPGFYRELAGPRCGLSGLEVLPVVAWALRRRGKRAALARSAFRSSITR